MHRLVFYTRKTLPTDLPRIFFNFLVHAGTGGKSIYGAKFPVSLFIVAVCRLQLFVCSRCGGSLSASWQLDAGTVEP